LIRVLYNILLFLVAVPGLFYVLVRAAFQKRYRTGLAQRLGFVPGLPKRPPGVKRLLVHCASVGEVRTALPMIRRLEKVDGLELAVSAMTPSGNDLARGSLPERVPVLFFPAELPAAVRRFLRAVSPDAVAVMETELWPNFLWGAFRRGIPVCLINGRISDRTFRSYRILSGLFGPLLANLSLVSVQHRRHAERFRRIGGDGLRVEAVGNMKFDVEEPGENGSALADLLQALWPGHAWIWCAASTHEGEEEIVLRVFDALGARHPGLRLLLAPRHTERADEVYGLIERAGLSCLRRTRADSEPDGDAAVLLLDTVGELVQAFPLVKAVFMGGTLVPVGGHNVLEPAACGVPVLFGPHMENFREVRSLLLEAGGGVQVKGESELSAALERMISDEGYRKEISERAMAVVGENRGASARNAELLLDLMGLSRKA